MQMTVPQIETPRSKGHSPTQNTQLMVERCLREQGSFSSKRALLNALPRKMEYATLVKVLHYLEASNKIFMSEDGTIVWVFSDNPKLLKLLAESSVLKSAGTQNSQKN